MCRIREKSCFIMFHILSLFLVITQVGDVSVTMKNILSFV